MDVPSSYPIPQVLRSPEIRFIKVAPRDKIPVEKDWQNTKNYGWNDDELVKWITTGGNYGILPRGGLCIIDLDDIGAAINLGIIQKFETFTVRSGSGKGIHLYVKCNGIPEKIPFYEKTDESSHIGEFYGSGVRAFAVGPGSVHPSGNKYEVTKPIALLEVTPEQMDEYLFKKVKSNRFKEIRQAIPTNAKFSTSTLTDQLGLRIEEFAMPHKPTQRGEEWQGSHPIHGSTTGTNFCVNPKKNVYYCHRCGVGGDPISWIAQTLGASCLELKDSVPPDYFKKVVDWLWENGYSDKLSSLGYKRKIKGDTEPVNPVAEPQQQPSKIPPTTPSRDSTDKVPDVQEAVPQSALDNYQILSNPQLTINLEEDNFIMEYIRWASNRTDAYPEYHFGMAISMLSIAAQRNAVLMLDQGNVYSNIWCFMLGLSSVSRRTTSINLGKRILDQNEIITSEMPKSFTPESLIEILDETPKAYLIKDEAAQLLVAMKRNYMSDLRYVLCDLYDGEDYSRRLRTGGKNKGKTSFRIQKPYITMVMATTPDTFEKSADIENLTSGWFYRYLWFYPNYYKEVRTLKMYRSESIQDEVNLRRKLLEYYTFFSAYKEDPIKFQLTDGGILEYNRWCDKINTTLQKIGDDPKLSMFARLQIHTLKLAMLFTIGRFGSTEEMDEGIITINDEHLREAMRMVDTHFLPIAWKIQEIIELAESENDQKKILSAIKQRGGKISRRLLMRRVRMKSKDLDDALHTLLNETRELQQIEVKGERGGTVIYYMMIKTED
jgi:hypothetical protein